MPARHDLIWLTPAGWTQALAGLDDAALALATRWRRGLPGIVRRREPGLPADTVCFGLPLPPDPVDGRKLRLALSVDMDGIRHRRTPLALMEILHNAAGFEEVDRTTGWCAPFVALTDAMHDARLDCSVFGSLAMQILTGDAYVTPGSDIDVLLRPKTAPQLDAGLALLARHAPMLPLDGEIVFPSGHAVAWKEWAMPGGDANRVLTKHVDAVALMRRDTLMAQFTGAAAHA